MKVIIEDLTSERIMRRACDMTRKPGVKPSTISREKLIKCEHSPMRLIRFWIELHGVPTFVATHLARHKFGVEHFIESNRDDRGGVGDEVVNRMTPVNHGMEINAAAVLAISRKRLCYQSHVRTVAVWRKVKKGMLSVCPEMSSYMVPECVVRGYCPELRECKPGLKKVLSAYKDAPQAIQRNMAGVSIDSFGV